MSALWHPAIRADWLVLRRTGPFAFARILGAPVLLLACCAALVCGDFYRGYGWCLAAAALLALGGSHAIVHQRLADALERWRFGWCAALPVARGAAARTLLLITLAVLMASLAFVAVLLLCVSFVAPHRGDLPYALAGVDLALVVGAAVAILRVFRRGAFAVRHTDGIREPMLALPWLNDPRLPHVLDWQRRAAVVKWRRGGGASAVLVLLAVPDGASIPTVLALLLFVGSLTWLEVVMRSSVDISGSAMRLLAATPLDARCARLALLRYPFLAASCVLVLMIVATMVGRRTDIALAWIACASAVSAWPLVRILRATRSPDSPA